MDQNFKQTMGVNNKVNENEKKGMPEKSKDLIKFCIKYGNPIVFVEQEYGENFSFENPNINTKIELKEEVDSAIVFDCLKICKDYLSGPIFTDIFTKNHMNRRDWEKKNEELMKKEKGEEVLSYYKSNRLGANRIGPVNKYLEFLLVSLKDSEIKKRLENLIQEIPSQLTNKVPNNGSETLEYNKEENDEYKIIYVKQFSEILKEVISILESKHNVREN